jgi:hypothetical protein
MRIDQRNLGISIDPRLDRRSIPFAIDLGAIILELELFRRQSCALLRISRRAARADTYDALWVLGEATLKSLYTIAAALTLFASGWTASAETAEERQACIGDAFRVCWSAIPDRNNVLQCLVENKSQLNPDCREVINRYTRSHRHRATRSAQSARSRTE